TYSSSSPQNLMRAKTSSSEVSILDNISYNIKILDVSTNGDIVIYTALNPNTKLTELIRFDVPTMQKKVLSENFTGRRVQFWEQDETRLIYLDFIDGRDGIFMLNIEDLAKRRVLGLPVNERYLNLWQDSKYTFYTTNKGVYVVDLSSPKNLKIVLQTN
ncbi:hypothetical protein D6810_02810, partial [Candidatus Dojkabacteria bacterium]